MPEMLATRIIPLFETGSNATKTPSNASPDSLLAEISLFKYRQTLFNSNSGASIVDIVSENVE